MTQNINLYSEQFDLLTLKMLGLYYCSMHYFKTSILVYSYSDNTGVYGIIVKWSMNYKYDTDNYIW